MLRRLPGSYSDGADSARLVPVRAAFALVLVTAFAALFSAALPGRVWAAASYEAAGEAAGFVVDKATPMLLAAAAPSATAPPSAADGDGPVPDPSAPDPSEPGPKDESGPEEAEGAQPAGTSRGAAKTPAAAAPKNSIRLLNTVEFRGELKNMPKWQRVVTAEQRSRTFDGDLSGLMRGNLHKQWLDLVNRAKNMSDLEKAKAVTVFFNRWPYKTDQMVYKVSDYWATPREFLVKSGDCEDYAITKFYALMKLGVDPEKMRIIALKDTIRNLAHAVMVIYTNNDAYILDNLTDMTLTHTRYTHYSPQYSVNEVYRWAHVRPKKKK